MTGFERARASKQILLALLIRQSIFIWILLKDPFIKEIYTNFVKRLPPPTLEGIIKEAHKRIFRRDVTEQELEYLRSPLDDKDLTQQKETANVT